MGKSGINPLIPQPPKQQAHQPRPPPPAGSASAPTRGRGNNNNPLSGGGQMAPRYLNLRERKAETKAYWNAYVNMSRFHRRKLPHETAAAASGATDVYIAPIQSLDKLRPQAPSFSILGKLKAPTVNTITNPGPGAYSPRSFVQAGRPDWLCAGTPRWAPPSATDIQTRLELRPGPGSYNPNKFFRSPGVVIGHPKGPVIGAPLGELSASAKSPRASTPGPADYHVQRSFCQGPCAVTMRGRVRATMTSTGRPTKTDSPGPGAYVLPSTFQSKVSAPLGIRPTSPVIKDIAPGPGTYTIPSDFERSLLANKGPTLKGREALEHAYL